MDIITPGEGILAKAPGTIESVTDQQMVVKQAKTPTSSAQSAMLRWAERCGWSELAVQLRQRPIQLEQESLDPALPD